MQEELCALIERHCVTLRNEAAAVRNCLARLGDPRADPATVIAEGVDLAHKIKGSSGSIGFRDISLAAQALEHYLRELDKSDTPPAEPEIARAIELANDLDARVAGIEPEQSTYYSVT